MISTLNLIIIAGLLAILYAYIVSKQILSASPGNAKMQEIASAIQEGARAYLNRLYKTIAIVGIIILIIITYALGFWVGLGYFGLALDILLELYCLVQQAMQECLYQFKQM